MDYSKILRYVLGDLNYTEVPSALPMRKLPDNVMPNKFIQDGVSLFHKKLVPNSIEQTSSQGSVFYVKLSAGSPEF